VAGRRETVMTEQARRFWNDQSGAVSIEYGMIAVFMSIVMIASLFVMSSEVKLTFTNVETGLKMRPAI
jgi:Flp pilus assembly pilin Flp